MAMTEWRAWCRAELDMEVQGEHVIVTLDDERVQSVLVTEEVDSLEFSSVVLRSGLTQSIPDVELLAWRRNRSMRLVGFKIDKRGRLVATAWAPLAGLTSSECTSLIRRLAREADLFEYQMTGADRE